MGDGREEWGKRPGRKGGGHLWSRAQPQQAPVVQYPPSPNSPPPPQRQKPHFKPRTAPLSSPCLWAACSSADTVASPHLMPTGSYLKAGAGHGKLKEARNNEWCLYLSLQQPTPRLARGHPARGERSGRQQWGAGRASGSRRREPVSMLS